MEERGEQVNSTKTLKEKEKKSLMQHDEKNQYSKNTIAVQLEPSLSEKLVRKRAVADKLDEEHKVLKEKFQQQLKSVDCIKEYLNGNGEKILQSLQLFGSYMRKIRKLKRDADDRYAEIKSECNATSIKFDELAQKYKYFGKKKETLLKLLETFRYQKIKLENIVSDLPQFKNARDLIEYYLVLKVLREDLLNKIEKHHEKEKQLSHEKKMIVQNTKRHPLRILEKENTLYSLTSHINDVNRQTIELEKHLDDIASSKLQEDMTWYDAERWIEKMYKMVCEKILPESSEQTDITLNQLETIKDFVVKGAKIVEKLKKT